MDEIRVTSTVDGSPEPSLFHHPGGDEAVPLVVGLHSWSYDRFNQRDNYLPLCRRYGFALLLPEFRGPNLTGNPRRREACGQCAEHFGIPLVYGDEAWDLTAWLRQVQGRDTPPERCRWCVSSRMEGAFAKARELGCTHFFSSLLYSKYQPHEAIREAGERLSGRDGGPLFLYRDFRPDWQAGIDLSIEMGLYRQPYCGCVYSEAERYGKKLARLVRQGKAQ